LLTLGRAVQRGKKCRHVFMLLGRLLSSSAFRTFEASHSVLGVEGCAQRVPGRCVGPKRKVPQRRRVLAQETADDVQVLPRRHWGWKKRVLVPRAIGNGRGGDRSRS
jgi:hypothetical protein